MKRSEEKSRNHNWSCCIKAEKEKTKKAKTKVTKPRAAKTKEPDYTGVHLSHCFQGEYEYGCKYGEGTTCPARPQANKGFKEHGPFIDYHGEEFVVQNQTSVIDGRRSVVIKHWTEGTIKLDPSSAASLGQTLIEAAKRK